MIASALGGNLYAQFDGAKTYVISNEKDATVFMQDNGTGIVAAGSFNSNSYWVFEATANTDCYYVKNAVTEMYMQSTKTSGESVATGTTPVEICVKLCSVEGDGMYGFASTDQDTYDFTSGTIGANWDNSRVQGYAATAGTNHKSFWKVVEQAIPEPVDDPDDLASLTGTIITAGSDIYLYNIDKDVWLQNNDWNTSYWTTRAEAGTRGFDIALSISDGGWVMNPKFGKNHSINYSGYYLDTDQAKSIWEFTPTVRDGYQNVYQITSSTTHLSVNDSKSLVADGSAQDWQIFTRAERIAQMTSATSSIDASWLIKSPDFANEDERFSAWAITTPMDGAGYAREGDNSPSYNCNRVLRISKARGASVMQTIENIPNGYYALSAQGAYSPSAFELGPTNRRNWETDNLPIGAHLYMNGEIIDLPCIYSEGKLASESGFQKSVSGKDGEPTKYFPGGINQISRDIFDGYYKTGTIIVNVTDGTLTIGVVCDDTELDGNGREWFVVDNFKLTYYGDLGAALSSAIAEGEAFNGNTTEALSNALASAIATGKTVLSSSTNPTEIIEAAEAIKTALANAEAVDLSGSFIRQDKNDVGYKVLSGGNGWGDSPVAGLVDNDATTKFGTGNQGDAWAVIVSDKPVAVKQYSFVTGGDTYDYPARNPRSWKLEGSNDNQTWTIIDQHNDYDAYKIHSVNKEEFTFDVNDAATYQIFKFTATSLGDAFQLGEFWINEQTHTWGEPTITPSTCTVQGKREWVCSDCKTLKTETLPLAEHTYANGVCTNCGAKVSEPVLLANGQTNPYAIKFRHVAGSENAVEIETGWSTPAFDDSAWDELIMPIGSNGYDDGAHSGAKYNTLWFNEYNTYWFRRTFEIANPATISKLTVKALHDDDYQVFVNGTKVADATGWTEGVSWVTIEVDPALLVEGTNVLAVYIEQNWGGAYCDFGLEAQVTAPVVISDALYTTFVAPFDVDFTGSEVSAFAAQKNTTYVHLEPVTTVPAGVAVVLKADAAGTYTVPKTTDADLGTTNDLIASTGVTSDGTFYALANKSHGVGFYPVQSGVEVRAGKGYLVISSGVKEFYGFNDDADGIKAIDNGELTIDNAAIYNLAGQRLNKVQKGINIVNGKKILK